jgi:tetratricopeptide (TPR) repeat protein
VRGLVATSIARVGNQYALTARLIDPRSGRVVRSRVEYAEGRDQVLAALKQVASALRNDLGESLAVIQTSDHPLERVTTPSLEALKLYSDGVAMWDKGEHKAALQLHADAIAEDPGFAAAHAALAAAYFSFVFADREKGQAHFEKALALAERTTDREQRLIRLSYVHQLGHLDEAYDLYRAYLQSYPDDFRVRHNFAGALRNLARFEEAAGQYREVLRVAPNHAPAHVNVATCYNPLGKYAEALRHYDRAFELEPSWLLTPNINHEYGFVLVRAGELAKARAAFERALASPAKASALRSIAMLDMYEGRYRAATARLGEALALHVAGKNALNEARTRLFLAMALEGRGKVEDARRELGLAVKAATIAKANPWVFVRIGVSMARLGMAREASAALEAVRQATDPASPDQLADLHRLEGELALARGDHAAAVARLTLADSARNSAFTVESLARAHRLAGNRDEAMRWSADLISKVSTATGFEPQQGWLEAHLRLARLRLEAGEVAGADELATTLEGLWREADADLPAVRALRALRADIRSRGEHRSGRSSHPGLMNTE